MSMARRSVKVAYDPWLLFAACSLLGLGLVMVSSSSIPIAEGKGLSTFYYAYHQFAYMMAGFFVAWVLTFIPVRIWQALSMPLLLCSIASLSVLLVPGISRRVNGSIRWLQIGPISLQVSEFVKLALIIYMSSYLVRHQNEVLNRVTGFLKPMGILAIICSLLLMEPDFGAAVVISATLMGMMFLGGVQLRHFVFLLLIVLLGLAFLSVSSSYRVQRLTSFLNPWEDQFNTGYQLTQALIAFGRGAWFGTGLGGSIQKLLYLPEPHTDFLFAVLAEELGLMGAMAVLLLFCLLVGRAMKIGREALNNGQGFAGFLAYGIGLWLGTQTLINIGVNVGVLPTKGLTLPLMSYGGSSMMVGLAALGLLLRVHFENYLQSQTKVTAKNNYPGRR